MRRYERVCSSLRRDAHVQDSRPCSTRALDFDCQRQLRVLTERCISVLGMLSYLAESRKQILTCTDWQNIVSGSNSLRCYQKRRHCRSFRDFMGHHCVWPPMARIFHRKCRSGLLQSWMGRHQECFLARTDDVGIPRNELQREESHSYRCWWPHNHIPSSCLVERWTRTRCIAGASRHIGSSWSIQAA